MDVACSNCGARYTLPDDKIPPTGAQLNCPACSHRIYVQAPGAAPEPATISAGVDEMPPTPGTSGRTASGDYSVSAAAGALGADDEERVLSLSDDGVEAVGLPDDLDIPAASAPDLAAAPAAAAPAWAEDELAIPPLDAPPEAGGMEAATAFDDTSAGMSMPTGEPTAGDGFDVGDSLDIPDLAPDEEELEMPELLDEEAGEAQAAQAPEGPPAHTPPPMPAMADAAMAPHSSLADDAFAGLVGALGAPDPPSGDGGGVTAVGDAPAPPLGVGSADAPAAALDEALPPVDFEQAPAADWGATDDAPFDMGIPDIDLPPPAAAPGPLADASGGTDDLAIPPAPPDTPDAALLASGDELDIPDFTVPPEAAEPSEFPSAPPALADAGPSPFDGPPPMPFDIVAEDRPPLFDAPPPVADDTPFLPPADSYLGGEAPPMPSPSPIPPAPEPPEHDFRGTALDAPQMMQHAAAAPPPAPRGRAGALIGAFALLVLLVVGGAVFLSSGGQPSGEGAPGGEGGPADKAAADKAAAKSAAEKAAEALKTRLQLPRAANLSDAPDGVLELKLTASALKAEDMDDVDVEGGGFADAEGDPPSIEGVRKAVTGKTAALLADEAAPFGIVAPVLFSMAEIGAPVAVAAKPADGEGDADGEYGLLHVRLDAGASAAGAAAIDVKANVKAKAGGGYKKLKKQVAGMAAEAADAVGACVRRHVEGKAKGKYKLTLSYDGEGKLTDKDLKGDKFGGEEPTPCIVEVFEGWELGEPAGGKAAKIAVAVSFKAAPPKGEKKAKAPPPAVVVTGDDEGYAVAIPGEEPFTVPKADGAHNALGLVARLVSSRAKLPPGVRARIALGAAVPHSAFVSLVGALAGEVEGAKLFADIVVTPAIATAEAGGDEDGDAPDPAGAAPAEDKPADAGVAAGKEEGGEDADAAAPKEAEGADGAEGAKGDDKGDAAPGGKDAAKDGGDDDAKDDDD